MNRLLNLILLVVLNLTFMSASPTNYANTYSYQGPGLSSYQLSNRTNPIGLVAYENGLVVPNQFPYQVLIAVQETSYSTKPYDTNYQKPQAGNNYANNYGNSYMNTQILCSGIIVNKIYVLVPANCTLTYDGRPRPVNSYIIRTGVDTLTDDPITQSATYRVSKVILDSDYVPNQTTNDNNLALLKLTRPISYNPYVLAACFDFNRERFQELLVSAYGRVLQLDPKRYYLEYTEEEEQIYSNCRIENEICAVPQVQDDGLISCCSPFGGLLSTAKYDVVGLLPSNPYKNDPCQSKQVYIRLAAYKQFLDNVVGEINYCRKQFIINSEN